MSSANPDRALKEFIALVTSLNYKTYLKQELEETIDAPKAFISKITTGKLI